MASTFGGESGDAFVGECDPFLQLVNDALVVDACVCGSGAHRAVGEEEARETQLVDCAATLRTLAERVDCTALAQPAFDARLVEDVAAMARRYRIARLEMFQANYALSSHLTTFVMFLFLMFVCLFVFCLFVLFF